MEKLDFQAIVGSNLNFHGNEHIAIFNDFGDVRNHNISDVLIEGFLFVVITRGQAQCLGTVSLARVCGAALANGPHGMDLFHVLIFAQDSACRCIDRKALPALLRPAAKSSLQP